MPDKKRSGPLDKDRTSRSTTTGNDSTRLARFDQRAFARATEAGMKPIDNALTATGLAAELRVLAARLAGWSA